MDDLQEIKTDVKELLQRSAVHNELLRTHEARSIALQGAQEKLSDRITPIENHVHWVNNLGKLAGAVLVGILVKIALGLLFH